MYLAYIDESGSTGDVTKGGSKSYTLGCVLVRAAQWAAVLDGLIGYRRYLKKQFGLLARAKIKANHLLQNGAAFRDLALSEHARHALYRGMLRLCHKLDLKTFAIVIRKELLVSGDPHDYAWTFLLQRLERLTTKQGVQVMVIHDEGDDARVRALARRARRCGIAGSAFGTGYLRVPFRGLLDDPVSRRSHESLFLQLADLIAYAAFRRVFPPPARCVQIVPELMWDELAAARLSEVNQRSGGPSPGIVAWPRPK
jgi:hypothetical protein